MLQVCTGQDDRQIVMTACGLLYAGTALNLVKRLLSPNVGNAPPHVVPA